MEFHYPQGGVANIYSDDEEDFVEDEELLTRKKLRLLAAAELPTSSEWETPPQLDGKIDSQTGDGLEGECDGETQAQCDWDQESEHENIDDEDSDYDDETDFCPETHAETDEPPRKKKGRCDKYKWEKIAPASRRQIEHDNKPYVKCKTLLEQPSALNCFLSLFTVDALQILVDMTNKNYRQKKRERGNKRDAERSHEASFTDITVPEMKAFIGLLIAMGMLKLPEVNMYWRQGCPVIRTVGFGEVMSRDRFMVIYRHLALFDPDEEMDSAENEGVATHPDQQCQTDPQIRLEKIKNFSGIIRRNCIEKYASGKNVAIDESMIPFEGRVAISDHPASYRQSIKNGLKIWTLVESGTSYVCNFQFYAGRDPQTYVSHKSDIARGVVMGLMEPFFNEGRHLYMDSFYTSPELLKELHSNGTYACGTVMQNINGFPQDLVIETTDEKCYSRGYFDWRMSENIVCYSWLDKNPTYFMSTIHLPDQDGDVQSTGCTVYRRWRRQEYIEIACPTVVKDYSRYMCAMEDRNQFCKYFNFNRKSRAWYRKVFGYLLEVCVHNSRVLLENVQGKSVSGVTFRESLITALIGDYMTAPVHSAPRPRSDIRLDKRVWHMPIFGPDHGKTRGRCRYCVKRKAAAKAEGTVVRGHTSLYYCTACNVTLCLSPRDCFRKYHEEVDFWP